MISDLWRLREAIDRGTVKGLYYGDFKTDLVDALDRLMDWEEITDEDLLLEGKNAEESLVALHEQVDALKTCIADLEEPFKDIEQAVATARGLCPAPAPTEKD